MKNTALFILSILFSIQGLHAQTLDKSFFNKADQFFATYVDNGLVDYKALQQNTALSTLITRVESTDLSGTSDLEKQAFFINAYNLHVIQKVVKNYPLQSVIKQTGFFDKKNIVVAGEKLSLNALEKEKLIGTYGDARYHFVLVCGAISCPPITDFAYRPEKLEQQLEAQTRIALNNPSFIKVNGSNVELSEIFKWYADDFGGKNQVISFINKYRNTALPSNNYSFYTYDWNLNDSKNGTGQINTPGTLSTNESRYIVSSTIPQGSFEFKLFNNLYSQRTASNGETLDSRSSFFTTSVSALYGLNDRVNVGFLTRVRRVRNQALPSSPYSVFGSDDTGSSRTGLTAFGPQIRVAPVPRWSNFSIQSSFVFPIGDDLEGNNEQPFLDWTGATWWTQIFNDFSIGDKFSLFTELDFLIEDIGGRDNLNRFSTPVTAIFSYVPTTKIVLYALGSYSPFWQENFDYFRQFGAGAKYQFTPNLELEVLYTDFSNQFLAQSNGQAETINLGLRVNI